MTTRTTQFRTPAQAQGVPSAPAITHKEMDVKKIITRLDPQAAPPAPTEDQKKEPFRLFLFLLASFLPPGCIGPVFSFALPIPPGIPTDLGQPGRWYTTAFKKAIHLCTDGWTRTLSLTKHRPHPTSVAELAENNQQALKFIDDVISWHNQIRNRDNFHVLMMAYLYLYAEAFKITTFDTVWRPHATYVVNAALHENESTFPDFEIAGEPLHISKVHPKVRDHIRDLYAQLQKALQEAAQAESQTEHASANNPDKQVPLATPPEGVPETN